MATYTVRTHTFIKHVLLLSVGIFGYFLQLSICLLLVINNVGTNNTKKIVFIWYICVIFIHKKPGGPTGSTHNEISLLDGLFPKS